MRQRPPRGGSVIINQQIGQMGVRWGAVPGGAYVLKIDAVEAGADLFQSEGRVAGQQHFEGGLKVASLVLSPTLLECDIYSPGWGDREADQIMHSFCPILI